MGSPSPAYSLQKHYSDNICEMFRFYLAGILKFGVELTDEKNSKFPNKHRQKSKSGVYGY